MGICLDVATLEGEVTICDRDTNLFRLKPRHAIRLLDDRVPPPDGALPTTIGHLLSCAAKLVHCVLDHLTIPCRAVRACVCVCMCDTFAASGVCPSAERTLTSCIRTCMLTRMLTHKYKLLSERRRLNTPHLPVRPLLTQPRGPILTQPRGPILTQPRGPILTQPRGPILTQPRGPILTQPYPSSTQPNHLPPKRPTSHQARPPACTL